MLYFAKNVSHSNVSCGGFGATPESAISAALAANGGACDFVKFVAVESTTAFFDAENGNFVFPDSKTIPPACIGWADRDEIEAELLAACKSAPGFAGVWHRDHRGEE